MTKSHKTTTNSNNKRHALSAILIAALVAVPLALAEDPTMPEAAHDTVVARQPPALDCAKPNVLTVRLETAKSVISATLNASLSWEGYTYTEEIGASRGQALHDDGFWIPTCASSGILAYTLAVSGSDEPALTFTASLDTRTGVTILTSSYSAGTVEFTPTAAAMTIALGHAKGSLILSVAIPADATASVLIGADRDGSGSIEANEVTTRSGVTGPESSLTVEYPNLPLITRYRVSVIDGSQTLASMRGEAMLTQGMPTTSATFSSIDEKIGIQGHLESYPIGVAYAVPGAMWSSTAIVASDQGPSVISMGGNPEAFVKPVPEPPALATPTVAVTNVTAASVTIEWMHEGAGATGFRILRSDVGGAWTEVAGAVHGDATSWTDAQVNSNSTYWYTVQAVAEDFEGPRSAPVAANTPDLPRDGGESVPDTGGEVTLVPEPVPGKSLSQTVRGILPWIVLGMIGLVVLAFLARRAVG